MSVTLLSTPDVFSLSRGGRTRYSFSGDGALLAGGAPAISYLNFDGPIPAGTTLNLRWAGSLHAFVFRLDPQGANELPAGDGSTTHADAVADRLKRLQAIRRDFVVSRTGIGSNRVVLTARQPGPGFNIIAQVVYTPGTNTGSFFPLTTEQFRSGVAAKIRERYGVYVELRTLLPGRLAPANPAIFDEDDFETIYATSIETDADGTAYFDAGGLLHSVLSPEAPPTAGPDGYADTGTTLCYYVAYGECYGLPQVVGHMQLDRLRWTAWGGLDYERKAGGALPIERIVTPQASGAFSDRALRIGDLTRYVRPEEPQFLTFLNLREATDAVLHIRLSFPTHTDLTYTPGPGPSVGGTFPVAGKLTFAVGAAQLGATIDALISTAGEPLKEFTVQLVEPVPAGNGTFSAGRILSKPYRYILNYRYEPYVRHFAYLNSLGGWDSLTTYGKGTDEWNRFSENAEKTLPGNYTLSEGEFVDYDNSLRLSTEVTTGFLEAPELLRWADFYRSAHRYRLAKDGYTGAGAGLLPLPISVTSKSIKQAKDGESLTAHRFEFIHNFRQAWVSDLDLEEPEAVLPPVGFQPVGSVTIQQTTIVPVIDPTVPQVARDLRPQDIQSLRQLEGWGNHATKGYLRQAITDQLYLRATSSPEGGTITPDIAFARIAGLPATALEHNIQDVFTKTEISELITGLEPPPAPAPDWLLMPLGMYAVAPLQARYYKICLIPRSTEGTYDNSYFELVGGGWESYRKAFVRLRCSNRNYFTYQYTIEGTPEFVGLRFYQEESGDVVVYGYQAGDFGEGAIRVYSNQADIFPTLPPLYGHHPPGILLLDTTDPVSYPPPLSF